MPPMNAPSAHHPHADDCGASAVEYGLLVSAIAAVILLVVVAVGAFTKGNFQDTCEALAGAQNATSAANITC